MAIAFDAFSSATEDSSVSPSPMSWTHTPVGTPRAVTVHVVKNGLASAGAVTGVTYGGVALAQTAGSPNSIDGGDPGHVSTWFLGSGIPTGPQTVEVTYSPTDAGIYFGGCITCTAADNCSIVESDATINGTLANPSCTLSLGGVSCFCSIGVYSGQNAVSGITPLASWTSRAEFDLGPKVGGVYTYDTIGTADVTAGWTQTSATAAGIALAIREGVPAVAYTPRLTLLGVG